MPPTQAMPKAKAAALKAIELDPLLAEAHTSLAGVEMAYDWDCAAAEKEYSRAIELNANYATAHHWYSHCLVIMGRFPEGIGEIQQAHELDPLSMTINDFWALALYYSRDYAQAVAQFRAMADLDPSARSAASYGLVDVYEQQGDYAHALEAWRNMSLSSGKAQDAAALASAYASAGPGGYWKKRIELAQQQRSTPPLDLAKLYARQGNRDGAMALLHRAYQERSAWLNFMGCEPAFDTLRADFRFRKLAREVGVS